MRPAMRPRATPRESQAPTFFLDSRGRSWLRERYRGQSSRLPPTLRAPPRCEHPGFRAVPGFVCPVRSDQRREREAERGRGEAVLLLSCGQCAVAGVRGDGGVDGGGGIEGGRSRDRWLFGTGS